jgi:hypothetical protein
MADMKDVKAAVCDDKLLLAPAAFLTPFVEFIPRDDLLPKVHASNDAFRWEQ